MDDLEARVFAAIRRLGDAPDLARASVGQDGRVNRPAPVLLAVSVAVALAGCAAGKPVAVEGVPAHPPVQEVVRFREKPDADLAESFLKFIFRALLNECGSDMAFFVERIDPQVVRRLELAPIFS